MNPLLFSLGGLVFVVGIFRRELLIQRNSFIVILIISVALFLAGLVVHFAYNGVCRGSGALLSPLVLALYRWFYHIFLTSYGRPPLDTWLDWREGMAPDRILNILYFVTGGFCWTVLAAFMS